LAAAANQSTYPVALLAWKENRTDPQRIKDLETRYELISNDPDEIMKAVDLETMAIRNLLKLWLEEGSFDLKKWYLLKADYFDRRNIEIFFNVPAVQNINERDYSSNLIKELKELKSSYEHLPETEREAIIQS
jgi:hypothetical protein